MSKIVTKKLITEDGVALKPDQVGFEYDKTFPMLTGNGEVVLARVISMDSNDAGVWSADLEVLEPGGDGHDADLHQRGRDRFKRLQSKLN